MFRDASSSSSEEPEPFNPIEAAAQAKRKIVPANPEDPIYKAITASLNNPTPQHAKPTAPKRNSRYIGKLVEMAAQRKEEDARVSERRLVAKQREEDQLYAGKERFVTSAYKKKLQRDKFKDQREMMEERLEEERRSNAFAGFYGNLFNGHNVAMGGNVESTGKEPDPSPEVNKEQADTSPLHGSREKASTKAVAGTSRKRRRSRFGDAPVDSTTANALAKHTANKKEDLQPPKAVPKKRGLRRNDAKSIAEYRRRYFERRAKRLGTKGNS